MVTRNVAWPEGTPCWVDLAVDDVGKAVAFYSALFGWAVEVGAAGGDGYAICTLDDQRVAGIGPRTGPDQPAGWTTYLAADDVDKVAAKITEAGGEVLVEPFDVADHGRAAIGIDPTGAAFGVWEAAGRIGVEVTNEVATLVWNEQVSADLDGTKRFYESVFGYGYDDVDGPYVMVRAGGMVVGGLGVLGPDAPSHAPSHWRAYFLVPDTDAAAATVGELGGRVLVPPTDTPYGRLAAVADDQGALFFVIQGS